MLRAARTPSHIIRPSLIFTLCLGLLSPTHATAESRLAQQALHCSAIFSVFAESLAMTASGQKNSNAGSKYSPSFMSKRVKATRRRPNAMPSNAAQRY